MPFLERDGVRIHYEDAGKGPAILFTHGFGATLRMFDPQVEALCSTHRIIRWSMRGHGETVSPDDPAAYSDEAAVGDMKALLDSLGVEQAVFAGMSLGGNMSMAFRIKYPERVRAFVLIDTGPGFKREEPRARWNDYAEGVAQALETGGSAAVLQSTETSTSKHRSIDALAMAARGMMKQHGTYIIDSLKTIDVPTLILVGADDHAFLAAAEVMAAKIPHATKHIIPDAGHASNMDQPAIVNNLLREFLGSGMTY